MATVLSIPNVFLLVDSRCMGGKVLMNTETLFKYVIASQKFFVKILLLIKNEAKLLLKFRKSPQVQKKHFELKFVLSVLNLVKVYEDKVATCE